MKLGINTGFIMKFEFEEGLRFSRDIGVTAVEVGTMSPAAKKYCDLDTLLGDRGELNRWLDIYSSYGMEIYSFSAHGEPLTPDRKAAEEYSLKFRKTCELMSKIGASRMIVVSGLPEGAEGDSLPAWIVNTDANVLKDALKWQWERRLIPYWKEHAKIATDHGITLCFEMQILQMVHTPLQLRRLREELGPVVACNYDISHMWVQDIDPFEALFCLRDMIENVHLKDTLYHGPNLRIRGKFDPTSPGEYRDRSWTFTLPGWGHDEQTWREVITALRFVGYSGILSLEMESDYMEVEEGLLKAAAFIKPMMIERPTGRLWWEYNYEV